MALRNKVLFTNEFGQLGINGASYEAGKDIVHTHLLGCTDVNLQFCNPLATGTPTMRLKLHTGYAQGGGDVGASCCGIFVAGGKSAEAPVALIGSCLDLNSPKSALNDPSPELLFQTGAAHYNWRITAQETVDKGFEIASSTTVNDNAYTSSYTNRLVIEGDTGHVGIGTDDPRYDLAVKGNNSTSVGIAVDNDSGSSTLDLAALGATYNAHGAAAGEVWFYSPDNINIGGATTDTNDIKFLGSGSERMRITSAGNVGIGTSSPDYDLHVQDDVEANIKIETNNDGASNFAGLRMFKSRGTNASPTSVANGDIISQIAMYARDGSNWNNTARILTKICGTVTSTDTPTDLVFSTGTTGLNDRLTIKSDGNVGIGSQPNKLSSTGTTLTITENDNANPANIELIGGNATGEVAGRIRASYTGNVTSSEIKFCLGCNGADNGGILFLTKDSGGLAERARIDSCGAFGIGAYGAATVRANEFFVSNYCSKAQIEGTGISTSSLQLIGNSTSEYPILGLARSRGTTIGSHTLVANNDNLGAITFFASDGSGEFRQSAGISAKINNANPAATISSTQTPTDLTFSINDGTAGCGTSVVGRFSHAGNFLVGCNLSCGNGMISALEKSGYGVLEARSLTNATANGTAEVIVTRAVDSDSTHWAHGCHTAFSHRFYTNAGDCFAACINSLGGLNAGLCVTAPVMYTSDCFCTGGCVYAATVVYSPNCLCSPVVRATSNLIPSGITCCNANIKTYTWPSILCGPTTPGANDCSYCYHLVRWSYDPFNWGNGGFMEFTLDEWYYHHRGGRKKYRVHSNGYYGGTGSAPQVVLVESTNRGGAQNYFGIKVVGPTVVDNTAPGKEYFDVYLATRSYHAIQVQMETNAICSTSNPPENACIYICTGPTAQTDGTCFTICSTGLTTSTECQCLGLAPFACGLEICGGTAQNLSRHDATLYVKASGGNDWGIFVDKPDGAFLQKWTNCSNSCAGLLFSSCDGSTTRTEFYSCSNGITYSRVCFLSDKICGTTCVLAGSCVSTGGVVCGGTCVKGVITCGVTAVCSNVICALTTMQVGGNDVLTTASSVGANFCTNTDINNRVVTANGDAGSLCGEANLTFDGSTLNVTGAITASGDITSTSDERVKSNISEINGAIDIVSNLCGRIFIKDNKENVGVIAQEVEKILPQVVRNNPDGLKSVSYGNIVGVLIEAIKDQNKTIRDQNCRIENLEKIVQGR